MTGLVIRYEDAAARFERDRKAYKLKLEGHSLIDIAQNLKCEVHEVNASLARMFGGVTSEMRTRAIEEELARCDAMYGVFYTRAKTGESEAAIICLRIMERRARLLGLDRPASDDSALNEAMRGAQTSSSERIKAALDRIVGKRPVIEGEVVKPENAAKDTDVSS